MIIVSSHRPFTAGGEFLRNQVRAHNSWMHVANRVIYLGPVELMLHDDRNKTRFLPSEDFPRIKTIADVAASQTDTVAVVNSDIVLTENVLKVAVMLAKGMYKAAVSRRYHYDPETFDLDSAVDHTEDRGRDIFIAHPTVWRDVERNIPSAYRIGHQKWDAWVCDRWRDTYKFKFMDFTYMRCVFHPNHGERKMPHSKELENI